MFLEPDEPPSRKRMSIVQDVTRRHGYATLVSSKVMCLQIAILSLSISARNVRKPLPMEQKTCLKYNQFCNSTAQSQEYSKDKRRKLKTKQLIPAPFTSSIRK